MCGGFVGDLLDGVGNVIEDIGDAVGNAVEAVVDNPIGAIVSVGSMALGVPPVWAGALGGAANAASTGGNILEGALTGGAMGYVGGAAAGLAGEAGAGAVLSSAAAGAAAGAAGAALTGQDILKGALTGGVMGGTVGAVQNYLITPAGQLAPVEDMSTWSPDAIAEQNALGNDVSVYNPDTGGRTIYRADGGLSTVGTDGSIWTQDMNGNVQIQYADGSVYNQDINGGGEGWDLSKVGQTPTYTPSGSQVVGGNIAAGMNADGTPATVTQTPMQPTFPVIAGNPNTNPTQVGDGSYNVAFKHAGIQKGVGINPGMMETTPFYNTTNDVQSKFYWGTHPEQVGPAFDAHAYNAGVNAPVTPWGLQQGFTQLTPQETVLASQGKYQAPTTPTAQAYRNTAYNPAAVPVVGPNSITGQIYLEPVGGGSPYTNVAAPVAPTPAG